MKRFLFLAIVSGVLSGCIGPATYLYTTAYKARKTVAEAEAVKAEKYAPYEYWSAIEYLKMSREKAATADYRIAWKYGKKSLKMGQKARKRAGVKLQEPSKSNPAKVNSTPIFQEPASTHPGQTGI